MVSEINVQAILSKELLHCFSHVCIFLVYVPGKAI